MHLPPALPEDGHLFDPQIDRHPLGAHPHGPLHGTHWQVDPLAPDIDASVTEDFPSLFAFE
jgi:hypothetical protein